MGKTIVGDASKQNEKNKKPPSLDKRLCSYFKTIPARTLPSFLIQDFGTLFLHSSFKFQFSELFKNPSDQNRPSLFALFYDQCSIYPEVFSQILNDITEIYRARKHEAIDPHVFVKEIKFFWELFYKNTSKTQPKHMSHDHKYEYTLLMSSLTLSLMHQSEDLLLSVIELFDRDQELNDGDIFYQIKFFDLKFKEDHTLRNTFLCRALSVVKTQSMVEALAYELKCARENHEPIQTFVEQQNDEQKLHWVLSQLQDNIHKDALSVRQSLAHKINSLQTIREREEISRREEQLRQEAARQAEAHDGIRSKMKRTEWNVFQKDAMLLFDFAQEEPRLFAPASVENAEEASKPQVTPARAAEGRVKKAKHASKRFVKIR